ncbi:MAG: 2-hydroxyacyl-CoA dehydratase [bacterium]|nr:2-hydroxyacyl-CoA dehydratase [bacterium]
MEPEKIKIRTLPNAGKLKGVMLWYLVNGKLASLLPWKKTAWTCAGFPVEVLWAYDIFPLHPENMATVAAARGQSERLIEHAETMGYSRDLCSYCKTSIGAVDTNIKTTLGGIDTPDIITCTNTICDTHWKWFQIQAHKLKVPFFMFDIPKWVSGTSESTLEGYIDYIVEQFYAFFDFMEKETGKKLNEKKMYSVIERSAELTNLWKEIYSCRKNVPSPYSAAETSASFFPLVVMPGVKKGIKFYKKILGDVTERSARGEGTLPPGKEKFRILFEGIPFWYKMRFMYDFAKYGAVVTFEPYTWSFAPDKTPGLSVEGFLREAARSIMAPPYSFNLEKRFYFFKKWIEEYKIDGVILHENMSCRPSSSGMIDLKKELERTCNIPVLILQCDMNDPRAYSEGPIQTRIETFIELMASNRN